MDVCMSVHLVTQASEVYGVPECEGNPGEYSCGCKGFKSVGICSHVLTINHIMQLYNVRYQLAPMGKATTKQMRKGSKGGPGKKPIKSKALDRLPEREPDLDDARDARLVARGARGK